VLPQAELRQVHRPKCQGTVDTVAEQFETWDKDLTSIKVANRELVMAELHLRRQVGKARRGGHSWAAIGMMLGISRQAAQQRFGIDDGW
jgi:hypothetical protein